LLLLLQQSSMKSQSSIFDEQQINLSEVGSLQMHDDFSSEEDFCLWVETNINQLTQDLFYTSLKSYVRELRLPSLNGNFRRVDLLLTTVENKNILIECKRPKYPTHELTKAIGQLMSYKILLEERGIKIDEMVLLSTKYCRYVPKMIEAYLLPIEFILLDKSKSLKICLHPEVINMQ
jgi:hypothetical protein